MAIRWQYQGKAEPVWHEDVIEPVETVTIDKWIGDYPSRLQRSITINFPTISLPEILVPFIEQDYSFLPFRAQNINRWLESYVIPVWQEDMGLSVNLTGSVISQSFVNSDVDRFRDISSSFINQSVINGLLSIVTDVPPLTYPYTSSSGMPTVEHFYVIPEFRNIISEYGTGKLVRNAKWTTPRYGFRIKYRTPMRQSDIDNIKDFFIARKGRFESFILYASPLGTTHTVTFVDDAMEFNYFMAVLSETGEVEFIEEI